ncbi:MAG: hypothetical protein COA44_04725 [Arcobacter sp.]|nr:MAG: hypothetical protein COA44_04725 [Arcobacter sp.]
MLKLYKLSNEKKEYWETWDNEDGTHTVHWGDLGTTGESKEIKKGFLKSPKKIIQKEIDSMLNNNFQEVEDEYTLLIEYKIEGMGNTNDIDKRHRLEELMDETLGWTGLGFCDGGSIGSGTMEVCNFVVDFEIAKKVIETHLKDTEFENYTRIFDENAD